MDRRIETIALDRIVMGERNPRQFKPDTDDDEALIASVAVMQEPYLVQPPGVVGQGNGFYEIVYGARRIAAARANHWQTVQVLVYQELSSWERHVVALTENMHHVAMNPIDLALAVHVPMYAAFLRELGHPDTATTLLNDGTIPLQDLCLRLLDACRQAGYEPFRPPIAPDHVLSELGINITADRRHRLTYLLRLPAQSLEMLRAYNLTEAALVALSRLDEASIAEIIRVLPEYPIVGKRLRRISNAIRNEGYSVYSAIAAQIGAMYNPDTQLYELQRPEALLDSLQFDAEDDELIPDALPAEPPTEEPRGTEAPRFDDKREVWLTAIKSWQERDPSLPTPWVASVLPQLIQTVEEMSHGL